MAGLYARFAVILAEDCARIGGDVGCYSFIAVDSHHILLAGLPAHSLALRPAHSLGHQIVTAIRRLQPFRYLHDCSDRFRLERIAGWASHPLESAAFSRRTPKPAIGRPVSLPVGSIQSRRSPPARLSAPVTHEPTLTGARETCYRAPRGRFAKAHWNCVIQPVNTGCTTGPGKVKTGSACDFKLTQSTGPEIGARQAIRLHGT
jgi:hypothetical protein